ncbi:MULTISPECIES: DNA topoisomerase (ATP-hydrolyzing) [unclassified Actinomyces]|uniref:DNA gyrase/topoisomerase IV subunit A n=1 Tax=unclassified Actinomyces TaxID=2609248 RepID=UPI0020174FD7|nr:MULTISPECIES: DNA topoisomerase (ATP-hydrolyzing) [unclassified Actinomyces]MCL3777559.1 DNA topoisomerase 4 subunit A [Actinomyces sp. AC-20-1]MCL3790049.1 DNA topoisomerase 4 subunit A [Actinomyces sp. 187325]MCL3791100.1 DNA topoisomerase 4 subunit A [Actinomyces sp. 186855]MCL3794989.1 DNA topoisomerase 4 subunit A [Actinomyces sp. 217892]
MPMPTQTPPPVDGEIVEMDLSTEMRTSFLEYAYSVIYARALPDARDGLKPVQRRILFQMDRMGLRPDRPHVKSSRVVGDVMGRLHPHGDVAIYEALVRLAQPFTMRLPLVDGHGNFGSLDDGPAAPRYTEARLAAPALALTADIDEDTVDFSPNYDYTLTEPEVLPAAFPNLLVNGASGIAVGMATNMAPHNLVEVVGAARHLLEHPEASLEDLMAFVPGPDLPAGGMIVGLDGIREAYRTGRGKFLTRATARIENITPRKKGIVVTELPYLVGPEKVIARIKETVASKKLQGITDVADLTDRKNGTRLVISVKNGYNPEAVLAQLYKHTPLEDSFGINNVCLVDGQPRTLGLRELLKVFVRHRLTVVERRTRFRLARRRERQHLVEGLLIAILDIDEVIQVVRSSEDAATARTRLMQVFDLSEAQASYILELQLRRLTRFSVIELEKERDALAKEIAELEAVLADEALLRGVVSRELALVAEQYGTPRRTVLLEAAGAGAGALTGGSGAPGGAGASSAMSEAIAASALVGAGDVPLTVPDDPCRVLLSATGLVARVSGAEPVSRSGARQRHDALTSQVATTARGRVGAVTDTGRLVLMDVLATPEVPRLEGAPSVAGGQPSHLLVDLEAGERVVGLVPVGEGASVPVVLATAQGVIKRVKPGDEPVRGDSWEVISLSDSDRVVFAGTAADTDMLVLITSDAQLLRFEASRVRPQGRGAGGMAGISLREGATVLSGAAVPEPLLAEAVVVTVADATEALPGMGSGSVKVTPLDRYPAKGRATGGVRAQRFLRGEDRLVLAWVGVGPARAVGSGGQEVALPEVDERRDASGTPLAAPVAGIG